MARTDKSATSSHRADDERPDQDADKTPEDTGETLDGGVGALRLWMSQALASTQTMMETFTQMQQLQARSLGAWGEMLESALHELHQARDAQALMSAAMKFGTRQWVLGYQQVGEAMSQLMDTEVQLANRLRGEAATVARQMMPTGAAGLASFGAAGDSQDASPLAQLGRLQDQWLAGAQRWIDAGQSTARH